MLILDAGNLPRFMACNGYRLLDPDPVFTEGDNTIREEGNAAHWLAQVVFNGQHTIDEMIDRKAPNGIYITAEMAEHVGDYLEIVNDAGAMECSYSIGGNDWQVNGRADYIWFNETNLEYDQETGVVITEPGTLHIDDFKYGYTIVEPERNWTLISHAIGHCVTNKITPKQVKFTIHQPRAPHRSGRAREWSISYTDLMALYCQLTATLGNPSNTLQTGPHCYKCPAFVACPARQDAEMNALEVAHTAYNAEISNDDLAARLALINRAENMLKQAKKAYEEQTMFRLSKGQAIDNYAIENDYTNRVWKDGVTAGLMKVLTGANLAKEQIITPRQAEIAGVSKDIVAMYSERRPKGSKLVRVDTNKRATKFFGVK